jgi:hypothetical protein
MSKYIFSTLPASQAYTSHKPSGDIMIPERSVVIKGGAGVADKRYETAPGVMTEVSAEEYEFLQQNPVFKRHVERKFIFVSDKAVEVEVAAADMDRASGDMPLTPEQLKAEGLPVPTHGSGARKGK